MIGKAQLESELRRLRRPPVPDDLRGRVLAAAASATASGDHGSRVRPSWSWRFAAVAAALLMVVAAGVWNARSTSPARPASAPATRHAQVRSAPGDDVVVFWLDDDTPVLVSLAEGR